MKKAIAMKCSQETFESMKHELINAGLKIEQIRDFKTSNYLVNNFAGDKNVITNVLYSDSKNHDREIHETFNAKIFLEACGIEFEKKFEITKEQIETIYADGCDYIKEWFPEVFKKELIIGKWYKHISTKNTIVFKEEYEEGYGFYNSNYSNDWAIFDADNWTEATPQEVKAALIGEIKKRYPVGTRINCLTRNNDIGTVKTTSTIDYYFSKNDAYYAGVQVFAHGKWATIIETISIQEAEKFLKEQGINKKIV